MPTAIQTARQLAVACARLAAAKKADHIVVLDVGPVLILADFFVIATCSNPRQQRAIADEIVQTLKRQGRRALGREGAGDTDWLLIDFGDVVVHLFGEERRAFYDLEGLWGDVKRVAWEPRGARPKGKAGAEDGDDT